ncbi:MAG: peptidase S15 [Actinomycetia bacterium]|nr:peptidase S15 [Actinomycetes bacterium]MCH9759546.1 peptidase S15 [Actinomycetes bacterium]
MSASSYIGRVGGLAVAFGIGTAVLTGYGVASADSTSSGGGSSSSSQGSSDGGGASDSGSGAQDSTDSGSSASESAADDAAADVDDDAAEAAAADDAAAAEAAEDAAAEAAAEAADDAAAEAAEDAAAEAAAEAADDAAAEAAEEADLSDEAAVDEAESSASGGAAVVETAALATPVLDVVDDVVNPADGPAAPPAESPLDWAAAAAARRELLNVGGPITVDPTLTFTDGVIFGNVNAEGDPTSYTYTLTEDPTGGGKVFLGRTDPTDPSKTIQDGSLNYLPFLDENAAWGAFADEQFTVMVSELSDLMKLLQNIPVLGDFVEPTVLALQKTQFLGGLLQPIIGYRTFAVFDANVGELVPDGDPVAYTTKVTSFDGVRISTNWFPGIGVGVTAGMEDAPTVFEGPGLGANGSINPTSVIGTLGFVPGISEIRTGIPNPFDPSTSLNFNYVSWDPRGEGASGGFLQLDNPFFEGRDVQHIMDYVTTLPWTRSDNGDIEMGMVGGSYGGGIQWVTAGIDKRVDTIVPAASWNSLNESLYPWGDFKTSWALLLGLDLLQAGARINSQIYPAIVQGTLFGYLNESQLAILTSSGPTVLVDSIKIPTLMVQGTVDGLFPLNQSIINAERLTTDPNPDIEDPTRLIWACGGHGVCLTQEGDQAEEQFTNIATATMSWLINVLFLGDTPATSGPTGVPVFQWYDQNNDLQTSDLLPSDPAFYGDPLLRGGGGGSLILQPLCCGGSGPQLEAVEVVGAEGLLVSPALASEAKDAINIEITGPADSTKQVVGSPKLTLTYSGFGTSRHIYAQLLDDQTDDPTLVLGNILTPLSVELDGKTHTHEFDLESIAYTMEPGDTFTLQIVGASSVYADATQWGFINVTDALIELPTVA